MVRQSSGAEDHPSVNQFLYIYRLLSVSNLIKSPARASIHTEPATLLVNVQSAASSRPPVSLLQQLQERLQSVLLASGNTDASSSGADGNSLADLTFTAAAAGGECIPDELMLAECGECDSGRLLLTCETSSSVTSVHTGNIELTCDSDDTTPQDCIFYYVSGFIAYKLMKFTQCVQCLESVSNRCDSNSSEAQLVLLRTYGKLQFPSAQLRMLLVEVEHCIMKHSLSACLYKDVTDDIMSSDVASHAIGCDIHRCSLTSRAVHLYVLTRLHFLNRSHNRKLTSRQEKHKLSKVSKLT